MQGTSAIREQHSADSAFDFHANTEEIGIWCELDHADSWRNRGVQVLFQLRIMSCMSVVITLQYCYLMQLSYGLQINYLEKTVLFSIRVHKLLANQT